MPTPSRNEVTQMHRSERRESSSSSSPYSQRGRKEKMASSRGWRPSIWKTLMFWRHDDTPSSTSSSDEDLDLVLRDGEFEQESKEIDSSENERPKLWLGKGREFQVQERNGSSEESNNDALSMMNSSITSEDQVLRLISPIPRQVRFELPSYNPHSRHASPLQLPTSASSSYRRQPYVAPVPPSTLMQMGQSCKDPLATVSEYLDNVVKPRGGECTTVEALGLSMLIQSSVKGSAVSSPTQAALPNRNPFVFPTTSSAVPLKPTFTTPNTDFTAIFSRPDLHSTSANSSTNSASSSHTSSTISRTLTRNPNGTVFFQGGGSARPRYRSSAFGAPTPRKKLTFSSSSKDFSGRGTETLGWSVGPVAASDGKRRRVGDQMSSSIAQPSGPTLASSSAMDLDFQMKEGTNESSLNGMFSAASAPRSGASQNSASRFGTSTTNRFTATPVRPSPLRQSVRAGSSSPSTSNLNQSPNGSKTNGEVAKAAGQAKALAIFAEIVSSASQNQSDKDKTSLIDELVNPYETRPPTKRTRRPARSARLPPPRPVRRTVSGENQPPHPPAVDKSPKKPTALETIEKSAPLSVQAKRTHAETNGNRSVAPEKTSKRLGGGEHEREQEREVIELVDDDEEEDEGPPLKKAKAVKEKEKEKARVSLPSPPIAATTTTTTKSVVEVIDVDNDVDVDMSESSGTAVVRPSEIIEPAETERSTVVLQQPPPPMKPILSARTLYPSSLSKGTGVGRFGTTPKEPSPLRNMFQPEQESATNGADASAETDTAVINLTSNELPPPERKTVPSFTFNSKSVPSFMVDTTGASETPALFAPLSETMTFGRESSEFSLKKSSSEYAMPIFKFPISTPAGQTSTSTSLLEGTSASTANEYTFSQTSASTGFGIATASKSESESKSTFSILKPSITNGFSFGQPMASSGFGTDFAFLNKPLSFGAGPSTLTSTPTPMLSSEPSALPTVNKFDDIESIKKDVLLLKESELPVYSFSVTAVNTIITDSYERASALQVPDELLPTFTFDKEPVSSLGTNGLVAFGSGKGKEVPPLPAAPVPEVKGFDWAAAGMKAPVSAGWTCNVCCVPNKDADSRCACCGENKP